MPKTDSRIPKTQNTIPKMYRSGPNAVKSVEVFKAYKVIEKTIAAVRHAASKTITGGYMMVVMLTSHPQPKVMAPNKI